MLARGKKPLADPGNKTTMTGTNYLLTLARCSEALFYPPVRPRPEK